MLNNYQGANNIMVLFLLSPLYCSYNEVVQFSILQSSAKKKLMEKHKIVLVFRLLWS